MPTLIRCTPDGPVIRNGDGLAGANCCAHCCGSSSSSGYAMASVAWVAELMGVRQDGRPRRLAGSHAGWPELHLTFGAGTYITQVPPP